MPKRARSYHQALLNHLRDPEEAAAYLNAALEDSDEAFLVALGKVAESHRMAVIAEEAGVSRESLYRMLSESGNPTYTNLLGILRALRLKLTVSRT